MEAEAGLERSEGETEQRCFKLGWKNNPASPLNCRESNQHQETRKTASEEARRMCDPLSVLCLSVWSVFVALKHPVFILAFIFACFNHQE